MSIYEHELFIELQGKYLSKHTVASQEDENHMLKWIELNIKYPPSDIPEEDDSGYIDESIQDPEEGLWEFYFNTEDEYRNLEKEEGEKYAEI